MSDRFVADRRDGRAAPRGHTADLAAACYAQPRRVGSRAASSGPTSTARQSLLDASRASRGLGECIFVAELVGDAGAARLCRWHIVVGDRGGVVRPRLRGAHIRSRPRRAPTPSCPGGGTLGRDHRLGPRIPRERHRRRWPQARPRRRGWLPSRRLRRRARPLSATPPSRAAAQAEGEDIDMMNDPAWETLAAARRCGAGSGRGCSARRLPVPCRSRDPHGTRRTRSANGGQGRRGGHALGPFPVGGGAEVRAVVGLRPVTPPNAPGEAAVDLGGPAAGKAERAWQAGRLVELLDAE